MQIRVLLVSDAFDDYARDVAAQLRDGGLRAEVDDRSEKVGRKIRDAEVQKTPYMLIVGAKEQDAGAVGVRRHGEGDRGAVLTAEFVDSVQAEIAEQLGR